MNSLYSLNNTSHLRKLLKNNPHLPLLIFCGANSYTGKFSYEQAPVNSISIQELTLYKNVWIDKDEFRDRLADSLCDDEAYQDLPNSDFNRMIDEMVGATEFTKAIIIYVGWLNAFKIHCSFRP